MYFSQIKWKYRESECKWNMFRSSPTSRTTDHENQKESIAIQIRRSSSPRSCVSLQQLRWSAWCSTHSHTLDNLTMNPNYWKPVYLSHKVTEVLRVKGTNPLPQVSDLIETKWKIDWNLYFQGFRRSLDGWNAKRALKIENFELRKQSYQPSQPPFCKCWRHMIRSELAWYIFPPNRVTPWHPPWKML